MEETAPIFSIHSWIRYLIEANKKLNKFCLDTWVISGSQDILVNSAFKRVCPSSLPLYQILHVITPRLASSLLRFCSSCTKNRQSNLRNYFKMINWEARQKAKTTSLLLKTTIDWWVSSFSCWVKSSRDRMHWENISNNALTLNSRRWSLSSWRINCLMTLKRALLGPEAASLELFLSRMMLSIRNLSERRVQLWINRL